MAEEPFVQGFRYVPARMYDTLVVVVRYFRITDKASLEQVTFFFPSHKPATSSSCNSLSLLSALHGAFADGSRRGSLQAKA